MRLWQDSLVSTSLYQDGFELLSFPSSRLVFTSRQEDRVSFAIWPIAVGRADGLISFLRVFLLKLTQPIRSEFELESPTPLSDSLTVSLPTSVINTHPFPYFSARWILMFTKIRLDYNNPACLRACVGERA